VPPAESVDFKLFDLLEEVGFVGAPLAEQKQLSFEVQCDSLASDAHFGPVADLKRVQCYQVHNVWPRHAVGKADRCRQCGDYIYESRCGACEV
jgi:hypothetical protein